MDQSSKADSLNIRDSHMGFGFRDLLTHVLVVVGIRASRR